MRESVRACGRARIGVPTRVCVGARTVAERIRSHSKAFSANIRPRRCLLRTQGFSRSKAPRASLSIAYSERTSARLGSEYCAIRTRLLRQMSKNIFAVSSQPGWRASISKLKSFNKRSSCRIVSSSVEILPASDNTELTPTKSL